jgi:hypothetical protein
MKDNVSKREQCRIYIIKNEWKNAFKLAKGFDAIFNKEHIEKLSIAYECLTGNESFYKMIGKDTTSIINDAKTILIKYVEDFNSKN